MQLLIQGSLVCRGVADRLRTGGSRWLEQRDDLAADQD
jgi:hypothetical protein